MAKCPKCNSRKGKRSCPALGNRICPQCCAEGRLRTIDCPEGCPFLEAEKYQKTRRLDRARSWGRDFLGACQKQFPDATAHEFAMKLQGDLYLFLKSRGVLHDSAVAKALEALKSCLSTVLIPGGPSHPLARLLLERLQDRRHYPSGARFGVEEQRRVVEILASWVRSMAGPDTLCYWELLSSFFDRVDFAADLKYEKAEKILQGDDAQASEPPRSPGGLILPFGIER